MDSEDPLPPPPQPADAQPVPYFSTPPALPPALPAPAPVPYFGPQQGRGWAIIATFTTIGRWHAANALLLRNGIAAKMGDTSPEGNTQLLVPLTELEWARELLGIVDPAAPPPLAAAATQTPRMALPVDIRVQPKSDATYILIRILLILAMVFLAIVTILLAFFWQ